jgi:hypothetical protein
MARWYRRGTSCRACWHPIVMGMAAQGVTTLRGRRLVAGSVEDPVRPRVLVAHEVFVTAGAASATALGLSLVTATLLLHGRALAWPLLAASAGAASGLMAHRTRVRAAEGKQHPPLPPLAVVVDSRRPVAGAIAGIACAAAVVGAMIVAAGHASSPSRVIAASLAPALFGRALGSIVPGRASLIRFERMHDRRVYQSAGSFGGSGPTTLYVGTAGDG